MDNITVVMHPPPPIRPLPQAVVSRPAPNPDLPAMADLDQLQEQLDAVDRTLAELNAV